MKKWKTTLLFLLLAFALLVPSANTQETPNVSDGLAVALVIDSSASMKDNDPDKARIEAAKRTIDLLIDSDQVCIVQFSDEADVLLPLRQVGGESSRDEIYSTINNIGNKGYTDLKGGLEKAQTELSKADPGKKKIVLLLSDGMPDLPYLTQDSKLMTNYMSELDQDIVTFKNMGLGVHCIALGKAETASLLRNIAQTTGGEYFLVTDPNELVNFFKSILIVNKNSSIQRPSLFYDYGLKKYRTGDRFPVRAGLKIGKDNLTPGPHLTIEYFKLKIVLPDNQVIVLPFEDDGSSSSSDIKKDDGIFSAYVDCTQTGESTLYILIKGAFKGNVYTEYRKIGTVTVEPNITPSEKFGFFKSGAAMIKNSVFVLTDKYKNGIRAGHYIISWNMLLIALVLILFISITALALIYSRKKRYDSQIKGNLNYKLTTGGSSGVLDLKQLGKEEVLITTENNLGADFVLPKKTRNFAFRLKKINSHKKRRTDIKEFNLNGTEYFYLVVCLPGTYLLYNKTPKSRQQVTHGDSFIIGDYVFELNCPEASEH